MIGRRGGRGKHYQRELQCNWRHCRSRKFLDRFRISRFSILLRPLDLPFPLQIPREMPSEPRPSLIAFFRSSRQRQLTDRRQETCTPTARIEREREREIRGKGRMGREKRKFFLVTSGGSLGKGELFDGGGKRKGSGRQG